MSDAYDQWQRIFASSAAGFVVHVDGVIADINETAIKILGGADKNDFIGKRFMEDFIHPDFHPIIKLRREQLKSGGQVLAPVEMRIRRLDGFLVDVLSAATGILSGESLYVEVLLIDITSVKRRERLLEAFSEMMNITTEEQNPLDIKGAMRHLQQAMQCLYPESAYAGYVSFFSMAKHLPFASRTMQKYMQPTVYTFSPLPAGFEKWLMDTASDYSQPWDDDSALTAIIDIPSSVENEGKAVLQPFVMDGRAFGCFFWTFKKGGIPIRLDEDKERLKAFSLAVLSSIKTFFLRQENVQRTSDLGILHQATLQIGKIDNLQDIANTVLDILQKEKGWRPAVIRFKSRTADILETTACRPARAMTEEELRLYIRKINDLVRKPGQGMTGYVIEHGEPIRSLDLPSDPRYIETDPGIRFGIYAPIPIEGKVEGAIGVESADYAFSESDLGFLSSLGELTGMAVRSVRLIEVLSERVRWLEILHEINLQVGVEAKPEELYGILINRAMKATGAESGALLIYDAEQNVLKSQAARGWLKTITKEPFTARDGITGAVFSTGRTRLSPHLEDDPLLLLRSRAFVPVGRANIAVPVKAGGMVIGVFHLAMKAPVSFSQEFIELVEMFGSYAGIIIRRIQLIDAQRSAQSEMRKAYDETLEGWARAIGMRDDETLRHTSRVVKIALAIGKAMHLDAQSLEDLRRGALLHDIGEIGIPDSILRKPGSLSKEEQRIMQTHVSFANELLKPIKYLERAIVVPYSHHERWDGTGYPQQLKGEDIPLLARIFAVADVYDAMTSDRPYRSAHTKDEALIYVRTQAGKHFDPKVVEAFLSVVDSIDAQMDEQ